MTESVRRWVVAAAVAVVLVVAVVGVLVWRGRDASPGVSLDCQAAMAVWKGERTDVAGELTTSRCATRGEWVRAAMDAGLYGSESDARFALTGLCIGAEGGPACG